MPRFLLVRGRQGVLVANPHAIGSNPMRVAGQRLRVDPPKGALHTLFEPCDEVMLDSPDLRAACKAGDLVMAAECIADDHSAARVAMTDEFRAHQGAALRAPGRMGDGAGEAAPRSDESGRARTAMQRLGGRSDG